ncbi:hypothetical protein BKA83DRAFT_4461027 [Pisolithus microcarpus]|nr:hypothetical protein BKA83DRAFT_4461027 [Pisolithus microcarpus]
MASSQNLNFSDFPNSDWNDVEDVPPTRRFTKSQNDFIREWLPWRTEYLNVILEGEQLAKGGICEQCCQAEGSIRCMSCTGVHAWCGPCAVKAHRNLPFHKVQRWNGTHYQATSLMELGFLWHVGHGGVPCPQAQENPNPEESGYVSGEGPPNYRSVALHTEGIFTHEISWCSCPGSDPIDSHLSLLRERLFPASISKPKTAFTFDVLNHFLIDALECKTSAMSFYQKLKRFTNNTFPDRVPDRYRELMRVSRLWRDLKHRKWFGFGHDTELDPGEGGLALFCPACPQPGINLPPDWKARYDRQYVIDGNFTAQHMKMNKPERDVSLSDGKGYMVSEIPYQNHLQQSLDNKERSTCSNHRAINAANINKSNLRSTGIGATACAQHGCFVPHSVVDFQKGERSRVKSSSSLFLPSGLEIIPAVGEFHLAAHKLSCFPRYSLNFVKGAGHLDGEILETLWAPFNKISPTARSMTQAHRQEVYDDHMRDSNWKKLVGMAPTFHEAQLKLGKNPVSSSANLGSVAWLAEGISIEDSQIEKFHSTGQAFLKGLEIDGAFIPQDDPAFCVQEDQEKEDGEFWEDDDTVLEAPDEEVQELASELMSIWMPSSIGAAKLMELGLHDLLKEEMELRIGQANDCLDRLWTDLGSKAMLYRQNFRTANSTREGTRTKKEIQKVVVRINKHVRSYQRARKAILRLDLNDNIGEKYKEIQPEDLAVSKEVTEENRFGQGVSKMAWFWMVDGEQNLLNGDSGGLMEEFYHINWLKARARRDRWREEVSLVRHEMLWTTLWFQYQKEIWETQALQSTEPGKEAYASKQAIRREFLPKLDPEDRDDEENIIKYILEVTEKRKEDSGEGEDAREEKARPTKAGDYKKPFTAFTSGQRLFKDEMDTYDRERRDTKDPKTIGQRNKIIQQWWESLSDSKKDEAGRAAEKWNKLGAPKETHDS